MTPALLLARAVLRAAYDPTQPRDEQGRWTIDALTRARALREVKSYKTDDAGLVRASKVFTVDVQEGLELSDAPGVTQEIDPKSVIANQPYLDKQKLADLIKDFPDWDREYSDQEISNFLEDPSKDGPPILIGNRVIEGHHRIAAAKLLGVRIKGYVSRALRGAEAHSLLALADRHEAKISIAVRYAFSLGRVDRMAASLGRTLPRLLARLAGEAGELAAGGVPELRGAEWDESKHPRDEDGKFTDAATAADVSLPRDTDAHEFYYHSVRRDAEIDSILAEGLKPGRSGKVFLSKDEIRERGAGFVVVRVPKGAAAESVDVVEETLKYRQFTIKGVDKSDVVRAVRVVRTPGHSIREDDLAKYALSGARLTDQEKAELPAKYHGWFRTAKQAKFAFSRNDQEAKDWAKKYSAELVTDITETTRKRIRAAVAEFKAPRELAKEIRKIVKDPDRALLIARTESIRAAHAGQRMAWKRAQEKGHISDAAKQVWIMTEDEKACPQCEALDGEETALGEYFDGDIEMPPAHPRCRCTLGLAP